MRITLAPVAEGQVSPAAARGPARHLAVRFTSDVSVALPALSAVALGAAVQVNFGQYHPVALAWLTVALALLGLCVAKPDGRIATLLEARRAVALCFALVIQFALLLARSPGATGELTDSSDLGPFRAGVVLAALLCVAGVWVDDRARRGILAALLIVHGLLGLWVLRAAPAPGIDVAVFQRDAADALVRGDNPYEITFKDPYPDSSRFYGPGVSVDGRLQFGYPYPPLTLLLAAPAHLLGDIRYAQLAAMTLAGALVALARPGRVAFAGAALLLFTPRGFFVLEAGWTEPFAVLFFAATVFAACRTPASLPLPLGLLLASKQYLILALLATPLLGARADRGCRSLLTKTAAVVVLVTLPLALWDVPAFVRSVVLLQFRQPFRDDALSYLVPLARLMGGIAPAWIAFALAVLAGLLVARKVPRTPAGFAAGGALIFMVFFAFNKQAFCNYYHFVIGALCCAIGSTSLPPGTAPVGPEPREIRV